MGWAGCRPEGIRFCCHGTASFSETQKHNHFTLAAWHILILAVHLLAKLFFVSCLVTRFGQSHIFESYDSFFCETRWLDAANVYLRMWYSACAKIVACRRCDTNLQPSALFCVGLLLCRSATVRLTRGSGACLLIAGVSASWKPRGFNCCPRLN